MPPSPFIACSSSKWRPRTQKKIFEARLNLALAYLNTERKADGLLQLQYSAFADGQDFAIYIAQAHKYLGQYYLNHGNAKMATPLLIKALKVASEINDQYCMQESRNFAAVSAAQELMVHYWKLIAKSANVHNVVNNDQIRKLLNWKDSRELFWRKGLPEEDAGVLNFEDELLSKKMLNEENKDIIFLEDDDACKESVFEWLLDTEQHDQQGQNEDPDVEVGEVEEDSLTDKFLRFSSFGMESFVEINNVDLNDNADENDHGI